MRALISLAEEPDPPCWRSLTLSLAIHQRRTELWETAVRVLLVLFGAMMMACASPSAFAQPAASRPDVMVHPIRGITSHTPGPAVLRFEPPDPCRQFHTLHTHARCLARGRQSIPSETSHKSPGRNK